VIESAICWICNCQAASVDQESSPHLALELLAEGVLAGVPMTVSIYHIPRPPGEAEYVRNVQEPILILVLFVDGTHERGSGGKDLVDEDEDGLLRGELDALADYVDELADCQVCGDQVLLLVDGGDVGFLDFLADDLVVC
jgi:hypothetical protein